jgi:hypothetical protein
MAPAPEKEEGKGGKRGGANKQNQQQQSTTACVAEHDHTHCLSKVHPNLPFERVSQPSILPHRKY